MKKKVKTQPYKVEKMKKTNERTMSKCPSVPKYRR